MTVPTESIPEPASTRAPLYAVRGVVRHFRLGRQEIRVLRGVDLAVSEGEFLAVRGSSGAGKSTLLHVLGLLDRPSAGSLEYEGRDLVRVSDRQRSRLRATHFAFVFQFYYLLPEFTALENVVMPAVIAGRRGRAFGVAVSKAERRERAADLLDRVGLGHRIAHRPYQLSGGERQRVAIARALMNQPRIVFCDEPTGNLDSRTAHGIHDLLLDLNRSLGQTVVVVTHEEAMARVADRELVMIDGRIRDGDAASESEAEPEAEAEPECSAAADPADSPLGGAEPL